MPVEGTLAVLGSSLMPQAIGVASSVSTFTGTGTAVINGGAMSIAACQGAAISGSTITGVGLGTIVGGVFIGLVVIAGVTYLIYKWRKKEGDNDDKDNNGKGPIKVPFAHVPVQQPNNAANISVSASSLNDNISDHQSISSISSNSAKQTYAELRCGITNDLMVDPVSLNCQTIRHQFSRQAIKVWVEKQKNCPLCKSQASLDDIKPATTTAKTLERFRKKLLKKGKQWCESRIEGIDYERQVSLILNQ